MFGIHHGHHAVEPEVLGHIIIHEKCLTHRAWVGHTGGLDNDTFVA